MIPFNAIPQSVFPDEPALHQPWLSTGLAGSYAVNAFGPRQLTTAKHTGVGVGSLVHLNDGTTRRVVRADSTTGLDIVVLTVDEDLPTWTTVRETTLFAPVDAMFISAGRTPGVPITNASNVVRGWSWANSSGTLRWTRSELAFATYAVDNYEITFRETPGSFAMAAGDSGGGFYTMDAEGNWNLQGIGVGIYLYNGVTQVNGVDASQFRPATPPYNVTYQSNQMLMPRDWLRSFIPLDGDANLDGVVDFDDLLQLAQHYGGPGTWSMGDFTGDQFIDFSDLLCFGQNYDEPIGDWFPQARLIPEPSCLIVGLGLMSRRRR